MSEREVQYLVTVKVAESWTDEKLDDLGLMSAAFDVYENSREAVWGIRYVGSERVTDPVPAADLSTEDREALKEEVAVAFFDSLYGPGMIDSPVYGPDAIDVRVAAGHAVDVVQSRGWVIRRRGVTE